MIERVISGFQDGADLAGILAAVAAGIPTGGWIPAGFKTESGPKPQYAALYGAREHPSPEYAARTEANIREADRVIVFNLGPIPLKPGASEAFFHTIDWRLTSPGTRLVHRILARLGRTHEAYWVWSDGGLDAPTVADFIKYQFDMRTLMIAGNRESAAPGIGAWVESYLAEVFRRLKAGYPASQSGDSNT